MFILLTDETNTQPTDDIKFFAYGGLFFPIEKLPDLHTEIETIRKEAGYGPEDI